MARLPRYVDEQRFRPQQVEAGDSGAADTLGAIADVTARLGDRIGRMADKAAANEGERAGLAAGLDGEFRAVRTSTIRGDAYDAAGIRAALEVTEAEIGQELEALSLQHRADPEGLANAIGALQADKFGKLDPHGDLPEIRAALTGFFARSRTTYVREALRAAEAERIDRNRAALETGIRERVNRAGRAAYVNGLDPEADKVLAGELAEIDRTLKAGVATRLISAEQAAQTYADIEEDAALQRVKGAFDRLDTPVARSGFLETFRADYRDGKGPLAKFSPQQFQAMERDFEVAIERDAVKARRIADEIGDGWKAMEDAAAEGLPPTVDAVARQRAMAVATGDPEMTARAELARSRMAIARDLQTRTPVELGAMQRQLQEKASQAGLTPEEASRYDIVQKVAAAQERALKSQPYQWGLRAGAIDEDTTLNLSGDAASVASLRRRRSAQKAMNARYGAVPFFEEAELGALKGIVEQGGEQMTALAGAFVAGLGPEAGAVLAEISPDMPVFANLAGVMQAGGSPALVREAAAALELQRAEDPGKRLETPSGAYRTAAQEFFAGAYLAKPEQEQAVFKTARLLFERRAREQGMVKPDIENDDAAAELWQASLDAAAGGRTLAGVKFGGIAAVNGRNIIVPPDIEADSVQARLRSITDGDLRALGAIGGGVTARQLQGAQLVNVGDGLYRLALGDPSSDDPRYVARPNGDYFTLDIRALKRLQGNRMAEQADERRQRFLRDDAGGF